MQFEEIYESYFKDIYRFLLSLTGNESLAEELSQETFFKALKAIDRFDGSSDIRVWLFTIARNNYYSYYKAHKNAVPMQEMESSISTGVDFMEQFLGDMSGFENLKMLAGIQKKVTDEQIKAWMRCFTLDIITSIIGRILNSCVTIRCSWRTDG